MAYNGWTNYETWLVNLWFGDSAAEYFADEKITPDASDVRGYVEYMYEMTTAVGDGFFGDVINAFMGEVNWHELSDHYTEEEV